MDFLKRVAVNQGLRNANKLKDATESFNLVLFLPFDEVKLLIPSKERVVVSHGWSQGLS